MKLLQALALFGLGVVAAAQAAPATEQGKDFWQTPTITGYGPMHPFPEGVYQPDKNQVYKILFVIDGGNDKPAEINSEFQAVARAINLFTSAGVPADHLKIVTLISGSATADVLDAEHYKTLLGVANPNLELIHKLRTFGVDFVVCAQAALKHQYQLDWINPDIKPALSALTTEAILQTQGYVLINLG